MKLETGLAWGIAFFALVAMTDIPGTAQVAAALAWLIFVSIMLLYGPKAMSTITTINTPYVPNPQAGATGSTRKVGTQ